MSISVKLEAFEGPLDLLLHLIDKNKVNIYDIPIVLITEQYLEYVNNMETKDLNVVSEFLVMSATLLDIKAKMLLPAEVNEDGEVEDPRQDLVQKLLEHKMYKYMSFELKDRYLDATKAFYKNATMPKEVEAYEPPIDMKELVGDVTLAKLNSIFAEVMKRQKNKIDPIRSTFGRIEREEVNMEARAEQVKAYLSSNKKCSFRQLLENNTSKMQIIVTFLIVLELIKNGTISIVQENIFDDIYITTNA
ncbi:MAG: segregation/condensation protein A [Lachnospiraceae bacterium]|nr:segregation/condensation protein A [Lachnospira sp.]MBR6697734.1 segregation/condensation protein A [Lachnospiraceae bacterium]